MISFWNITSDKLSQLSIEPSKDKIIFVSDTERIYTDFAGSRKEYRDIIYVQDINNIPSGDIGKSLIYFETSSNKLYFYGNDSYIMLNPDSDSLTYIGKMTMGVPTDVSLNTFVQTIKGRASKINDLVLDVDKNQWLKVDNKNDGHDWTKMNPDVPTLSAATYETSGLIRIQEGCGLIVSGGVLSLNLMDENRLSGQIVTLNTSGMIDDDIYKQFDQTLIEWNEI